MAPTPLPESRPATEGFWVGTTPAGEAGALVIAPDGTLRGYLTAPSSSLSSAGSADVSLEAPVVFSGGEFSGTGTVVHIRPEQVRRNHEVVRGQVAADGSLTATFPDGTAFSADYRPRYGQVAALEAYAGVYRGRILDDHSDASYEGTLTLSRQGVLTHLRGFCTVSGRVQQLSPARGALRVELTHSMTERCGVGTEPRSGVVVLDTAVSPARLYVITTKPGTGVGEGFRFVGERQGV